MHAAKGADLAEQLEGAIHRRETEFGAALAGGVEDLHGTHGRRRLEDGLEHGAALTREAQAAGRKFTRDLIDIRSRGGLLRY
jgi:hypothetical protein